MIGMSGGDIDTMSIPLDAFIISEEDSIGYNQIKGRSMQAKFRENKLHKMWLNGNSESIYFTKDDQDKYLGMNKATCSDMYITFENNKPSTILFKKNPEGSFSPMHLVLFEENKLDGFIWRKAERPVYPDWAFPLIWPEFVGKDSLKMEMDTVRMELDSVEFLLSNLFPNNEQPDTQAVDTPGIGVGSDSMDVVLGSLGQDSLRAIATKDSILQDSLVALLADSLGISVDSLLRDSAYFAQTKPRGKGGIKGEAKGKIAKTKKKFSLKEWWKKMMNPDPEVKLRKQRDKIARKGARYMERMRKKAVKKAKRKKGLAILIE
ncbi:MAG TPA: hypothetical protein ENJ82_10715 [Bacteroidetes bacterium]|nr:hypothetical protein [Bacteroidota bacterium]